MFPKEAQVVTQTEAFVTEHPSFITEHSSLPAGSMLLELAIGLEQTLQAKQLLRKLDERFSSPISFIAETERNIFLWRNGRSIADHADFEFWIDVPKLIEKRKKALLAGSSEDPFVNSLWGAGGVDTAHTTAELEYLEQFASFLSSAQEHLFALSRVAELLQSEQESCTRPSVILPARR